MIDWFFGLLTPAQWEAWRNTLATLGGLVALLIAASTYARNVRIKREEQARLVYSKFTDIAHHEAGQFFNPLPNGAQQGNGCPAVVLARDNHGNFGSVATSPVMVATVIIHNGSKELIGPARVQMVNAGIEETWEDFSISLGSIEPETDAIVAFTWANEFHPALPALSTTLIFRDASGQWWRRHKAEPIERVHDDPENSGPSAKERVAIRKSQELQGIPEALWIKEPELSVSVRWHRSLRKSAGKSAIP